MRSHAGVSGTLVETDDSDAGLVIEVKHAPTMERLEDACTRAMVQINTRRYDERLRNDGRNDALAFGVAFWKKRCKEACERL